MSFSFEVNGTRNVATPGGKVEEWRRNIRWRSGKREDLSGECRFLASRDLFARAKSLETPAAYCTLGIPTAGVFCICILSHSHLSIRRRVSVERFSVICAFRRRRSDFLAKTPSRDGHGFRLQSKIQNWFQNFCQIFQKSSRKEKILSERKV